MNKKDIVVQAMPKVVKEFWFPISPVDFYFNRNIRHKYQDVSNSETSWLRLICMMINKLCHSNRVGHPTTIYPTPNQVFLFHSI